MSESWEKTQAKLLADIEAFSRGKPNIAPESPVEPQAARSLGADQGVSSPPAQVSVAAPTSAAVSAAEVAQAPAAAVVASPAGGGLLEKLKREAQAKLMTDSQRFSLQGEKKRHISDVMESTFHYLRELCEQINILKPSYPLPYSLLGLVTLEGLSWQEGRADFRLVPDASEDRLLDQVTLRFRLTSGQQLRIERENPAHEAFRAALLEANIAAKEEEFRNQKNHVERVAFTFPAEVKAGLAFAADYKMGDIRLLLRNIRRFGAAEYRLPFEVLDQATFEELARLILGEENRIDKIFRRVA